MAPRVVQMGHLWEMSEELVREQVTTSDFKWK